MKKKNKKIVIIGKSTKFKKIISSIFYQSDIKVFSWRSIKKLKLDKNIIEKKVDLILVCGYDFLSHWYSFRRYYNVNVILPLKLIDSISTNKTIILYIDTIYKVKKNSKIKKRYTFSRYEYAKKELAYKLFKKFNNLKILNIPVIKNNKNKVDIFGNKFMIILFNILLYLDLVNSVKISKLKKMVNDSINTKTKINPFKIKPLGLSIPRSLFLDRLLRFIYD
ncbi:hypothetical protein [Candidatus Pelagibacter ubique]|uniref:hypothetical protein n=1 Tax=Pelagibacter ubique TaxID=198252 RepID=UPI0003C7FEE7